MTLSETLRAAGDTFWTAAARLVLAWAVFTPAAFLVVYVWGGGPVGAMLCLVGYLACSQPRSPTGSGRAPGARSS